MKDLTEIVMLKQIVETNEKTRKEFLYRMYNLEDRLSELENVVSHLESSITDSQQHFKTHTAKVNDE